MPFFVSVCLGFVVLTLFDTWKLPAMTGLLTNVILFVVFYLLLGGTTVAASWRAHVILMAFFYIILLIVVSLSRLRRRK
ncbi:hypothetical protein [Lactobacillus selangorensis]|uniref:hypothetical protein n=1 Tax=Lactobacillus selangorensis TaxID=81857 RepID=UPI00070A21B0|nr:hypothetical protein [Lactobacillus selangorensis]